MSHFFPRKEDTSSEVVPKSNTRDAFPKAEAILDGTEPEWGPGRVPYEGGEERGLEAEREFATRIGEFWGMCERMSFRGDFEYRDSRMRYLFPLNPGGWRDETGARYINHWLEAPYIGLQSTRAMERLIPEDDCKHYTPGCPQCCLQDVHYKRSVPQVLSVSSVNFLAPLVDKLDAYVGREPSSKDLAAVLKGVTFPADEGEILVYGGSEDEATEDEPEAPAIVQTEETPIVPEPPNITALRELLDPSGSGLSPEGEQGPSCIDLSFLDRIREGSPELRIDPEDVEMLDHIVGMLRKTQDRESDLNHNLLCDYLAKLIVLLRFKYIYLRQGPQGLDFELERERDILELELDPPITRRKALEEIELRFRREKPQLYERLVDGSPTPYEDVSAYESLVHGGHVSRKVAFGEHRMQIRRDFDLDPLSEDTLCERAREFYISDLQDLVDRLEEFGVMIPVVLEPENFSVPVYRYVTPLTWMAMVLSGDMNTIPPRGLELDVDQDIQISWEMTNRIIDTVYAVIEGEPVFRITPAYVNEVNTLFRAAEEDPPLPVEIDDWEGSWAPDYITGTPSVTDEPSLGNTLPETLPPTPLERLKPAERHLAGDTAIMKQLRWQLGIIVRDTIALVGDKGRPVWKRGGKMTRDRYTIFRPRWREDLTTRE